MELADKALDTEIDERAKNKLKYTEDEVWQFLKQMIRVLATLQKLNIAHRDIKPQNIIKVGSQYKIIDLDLGRSYEESTT